MWVVEIALISVCWMGIDLYFSIRIGIDLFFFDGGKRLVLVWIEMNSGSVSGHRNRLGVTVGIETDLFSERGSKLTWFLCAGSKSNRFWFGNRN